MKSAISRLTIFVLLILFCLCFMQNKMLDHEVSFGVEHICLLIPELSGGAHSCYWKTHQHLLTATTQGSTRLLIMYTSYKHIYETETYMLFSAVGTLHEEMHHFTTQNNVSNC